MSDLNISDALFMMLNDVARRENLPVDEVVESVLFRYALAHRFPTKPATPEAEPPENEHPFLVIARCR